MKSKIFSRLAVSWLVWVVVGSEVVGVEAQTPTSLPSFEQTDQEIESDLDQGVIAIEATAEADMASSSGGLVARVTEKGPDLTEPRGEAQGKLGRMLMEQELGPMNGFNVLRHLMKSAVSEGVPANTMVLVLLFPLVTAIIAASRHLVGLRGFGIFTPALVSVGFLATGISSGLVLFLVIIVVATLGRPIIKRLRLPYMPRTSLLLWLVSMAVLGLLLSSPYLNLKALGNLSIFPVLVLVLLAETFIDVQNKRGMDQAVEMTMETLILALIAYLVMNMESVQTFVLLNPELVVVGVAVFNVFLGRFSGLRLLEYKRFKSILD